LVENQQKRRENLAAVEQLELNELFLTLFLEHR
jgi:hypothetical protein